MARVQEIKQTTTPQQWHHVLSNDNPADLVSRGATVLELSQKSIWFDGPTYLQQTDITDYIVKTSTERKVDEKDPEVRKLAAFSTKTTTKVKLTYRFAKFSNWKSLIRSIALLKNCAKAKSWKITKPSLANLNDAENFIIKKVQQEKFLKMEKDKTLVKLNPVLDENGMIRIGGRAERASGLHHSQKHPLIIPKASHIGHLLSKHYHEKIYHLGQRSTLAMIRDAGFWILNGTGQEKSLIRKCVGCARLRKPPQSQLMGQLPRERESRTNSIIHAFLSSDALINALRCFMAVRGPVNTIHCDNGTNLVGAKNELYRHSQIANRELQNYLEDNSITFKFNSPDASHQGGSWERLIRSVRAVLNGMSLKYSKRLDSQTLRTAFFEAASIINSRPITAMGINNPEEHILTPNHLLTMKTKLLLAPPPGSFSPDEIYGRKRWKMAQQFAEEFWTIWKAEYLQQMQIRQKWTNIQRNIKTEDIVLVKDENAPRCDWRIGIITDTISDADGLVGNVKVRLGNKYLDKTGRPLEPPVILSRPIQKIVLLEFN
ncbi:uncharacterized protein [Watersipora subatra]|uniref:uncharacterized protein n=1 Tax=Watersipora subatra TaxID=2589382 RepID=UPI00355B0063